MHVQKYISLFWSLNRRENTKLRTAPLVERVNREEMTELSRRPCLGEQFPFAISSRQARRARRADFVN